MKTLGYRISTTRNMVVEKRRLRNEQIVFQYSQRMSADARLFFYVRPESLSRLQSRPSETGLADLDDVDHERVSFDQIPRVARELAGHPIGDSRRTEQTQGAISSQSLTKEVIESDEVIDMSVGNEDIRNFEQLAGG